MAKQRIANGGFTLFNGTIVGMRVQSLGPTDETDNVCTLVVGKPAAGETRLKGNILHCQFTTWTDVLLPDVATVPEGVILWIRNKGGDDGESINIRTHDEGQFVASVPADSIVEVFRIGDMWVNKGNLLVDGYGADF